MKGQLAQLNSKSYECYPEPLPWNTCLSPYTCTPPVHSRLHSKDAEKMAWAPDGKACRQADAFQFPYLHKRKK